MSDTPAASEPLKSGKTPAKAPPPFPDAAPAEVSSDEPVSRARTKSKEPTTPVWAVIHFFSSMKLATVILFFLFILTWLGTLEQIDNGLYDTQKKYFNSLGLVHMAYGVIPVPLPGGKLLLSLLFVNIVSGGIVRLRKRPKTVGILIAHLSIAFLIVAGGVEYLFKKEGNMALWPGEQSNIVMAYHDWQLEISEIGNEDADVWIIPDSEFGDLAGDKGRTFHNESLPFELTLFGYLRNCNVAPAQSGSSGGQPVVDGFFLSKMDVDQSNERNVGGVLCEVKGKGGEKLGESVFDAVGVASFYFRSR